MFIFVIVANVIAALMACCGAIQMYHVIDSAQRSQGALLFFTQLGEATLPLLGAAILYGLVQISQFLEVLSIQQQYTTVRDIPSEPIKPKPKKKKESANQGSFFGSAVNEPDPVENKSIGRVLPPIPELEIMPDPDEAPPVKKTDDDGMSFFRMN